MAATPPDHNGTKGYDKSNEYTMVYYAVDTYQPIEMLREPKQKKGKKGKSLKDWERR